LSTADANQPQLLGDSVIYLLTYFVLIKMEAEPIFFTAFWVMAAIECFLAISNGCIEAYNETNERRRQR
jgi:hypothetical protein